MSGAAGTGGPALVDGAGWDATAPGDPAVRGAFRRVAARLGGSWVAVTAWATAVAAVAVVAWQPSAGLDPTDEASYLQSVLAPGREDAHNGFFGLYLRPLWALAGWDVARVRLLGLAVLVAVAVLLGQAVARLSRLPRAPLVAMSVAASTGYYASTWRTPSYNWLTLIGAVLVCTGLLRLLGGGRPAWGLACGAGVAVAATGKLPSAVILAAVVVVTAWRRARALAWGGAVLGAAVAVHLAVVLPAAGTLRLLRSSAAMLAVVSPASYSPVGAAAGFATGWGHALLAAVAGGGVIGLLPLALAPRGPRRAVWFRPLSLAVVAGSVVIALADRAWVGGTGDVNHAAGLLPVLVAIVTASAVSVRLGLGAPGPRSWWAGCAALVAATGACVFGSNTLLSWQLDTLTLLLAPACVLASGALRRDEPGPGGRVRYRTGVVPVLVLGVCAGSLVTAIEAHGDPRRSAPLAEATVPVLIEGGITVRTDPDTAADLAQVGSAARAAGWRPGTPLIDTTFTPLLPLALGARVPPVLFPAFPGYDLASVCQAVRGLGPQWRDAWLVVLPGSSDRGRRQVAGYLGRRYPEDYVPVGTFRPRGADFAGLLLRPVAPVPARPGPAGAATSCLAPG